MNNLLFGQKIEVLTDQHTFNNEDLTIEFDVPFDDGTEPNISTIKIYNLHDQTITRLKIGTKITINAGYQNDVGTIFTGEIQLPETWWSGIDKKTELDCIDSGEKWFKTEVEKTYGKNSKGQQIITDLLRLTGLKASVVSLPVNKVYQSGKTIKGKLAEAIAEVAKDCGAKVNVTKGKIFIRPKGAGDDIHFVLNKEHGLIGSPSPIEKEIKYTVIEKTPKQQKDKKTKKTVTVFEEKKVEKSKKIQGWKVVSLLNHRISTDAILEIKSKTANGKFRVEEGKHTATNNKFYTEMEVYPL